MLSRTSFDSLKFCDTINKLSLLYDIDEVISFLLSNESLEIEKKGFLLFLIYKFNLNYFDFQVALPESNHKTQLIKKIKQKYFLFFEEFSLEDLEKHFEEIIILKIINDIRIRIKQIIESLRFNSNDINMPNEIMDLFINKTFLFTLLLFLKFKYQISFINNHSHNLLFQSFSNSIVNLELFNELNRNHLAIKTHFTNLLTINRNSLKLNQLYNIYEGSFGYFTDIYLKPNKYLEKVDFKKNLNFIFSDDEDISLSKSYMILCMNSGNLKEKTGQNTIEETTFSNVSYNILFEENILQDFISLIRNSHVFSKKLNKIKYNPLANPKDIPNEIIDDFISFDRHFILSKKIYEIFKIDENSKIMIYGPNNSGKTTFIKKFTNKELLIDVDESLEVNVRIVLYLNNYKYFYFSTL